MHLFIFVRGVKHQVDQWMTQAQSQFFVFNRKKWNEENKSWDHNSILMAGGLRPSYMGMYEYVFPKESLCEVLSIFGLSEGNMADKKLAFWAMRLGMGLRAPTKEEFALAKKIPNAIAISQYEPGLACTRAVGSCIFPGVGVRLIGIKEDPVSEIDFGPSGKYIQELI